MTDTQEKKSRTVGSRFRKSIMVDDELYKRLAHAALEEGVTHRDFVELVTNFYIRAKMSESHEWLAKMVTPVGSGWTDDERRKAQTCIDILRSKSDFAKRSLSGLLDSWRMAREARESN